MNRIYLRRCRKVYVPAGAADRLGHVAAIQRNIASLGFILKPALADRLRTLPVERLAPFYEELISNLRALVGADRVFKPFYPNFPAQVMEMSEAELYLNALVHYFTLQRPGPASKPRPALTELSELRPIDLGSPEEFDQIFRQLVGSRTSLSAEDKEDLGWFVVEYGDGIARLLPAEIPFKENLAVLGAQLVRRTSLADTYLAPKLRTATDVLRLAVALSDGDVSLATPARFAAFRRRERRWLLARLEQTGNPTEDMLRWPERWKRLGERLHPGEMAKQFPTTAAAFDVLRNDRPFVTANARIEALLGARDVQGVLAEVQARPGELARRLDHLLRLGGGAVVSEKFRALARGVATPVLLQVLTHFKHRGASSELRTFFPKGDLAKVFATPDRLPPLALEETDPIVQTCEQTLLERFTRMPALGRCFIDPRLTNYLVPFSQRSAAKALRTLPRGSRLPLPDGAVVRFFLWWKNGKTRTDIDLSAAFFDGQTRFVDEVTYYNLKNLGGHHSGDIVDAPNGAAEFIDLHLERTRATGVRYVVMCLNSFTAQPYCDLPECFAGWMMRAQADSGEIFEPRTVQDRVDVGANTRICLPVILDLERREVIWADLALRARPCWNNLRNNLSGVSVMVRALARLRKTDLHTLFSLHAQARGELVSNRADAESIFAVDAGVTPFDVSRIAAEFM